MGEAQNLKKSRPLLGQGTLDRKDEAAAFRVVCVLVTCTGCVAVGEGAELV